MNKTVPQIIHTLHLGYRPAPRWAMTNAADWQTMNPEWTVRVHDDSTAINYVDMATYERMPDFGAKGDYLRFCILNKDGGVYVDWDMIPLRPLDDMLDNCGFCAGCTYTRNSPHATVVETAFLASVSEHPVVQLYLQKLPQREALFGNGSWLSTGPGFLTEVVESHLSKGFKYRPNPGFTKPEWYGDTQLLPFQSFYLRSIGKSLEDTEHMMADTDHVYGYHEWRHSWV